MQSIPFPVARVGSALIISVEILNCADPHHSRMDPTDGVYITITYGPNRTATSIVNAAMTRTSEVGVYVYTYQSAPGDATGLYNAELTAVHGATQQKSQFYGVFRLIP